ncbi:MAG: MFS transporter [Clostridia bacterium]|nr:MFS transporter [Clostridia bacterium]
MNHGLKAYIVFWFSQALSQLGSAMTGFTLILWAYEQDGAAMTVSLMSFFNYVPFIIASIFAGTFADSHSKKKIMLVSDCIAALCSAAVFSLSMGGGLQIWNIYLVNLITGFMNAFQGPASAVAIGRIVPKDRIKQVSGMNAFSGSLVTVLAPVLAASLYAFGGLPIVIIIDLASFVLAFAVLAFVIKIPEEIKINQERTSMLSGTREGLVYLQSNQGILMIILTMALLNFFSRLTYENILSPMILARSGNNHEILGVVNAAMGAGGIAGGLVVSSGKVKGNSVKMIYVSAMFSFLLGDVMMGVGRNAMVLSLAAAAASLPIAFINAGQLELLYCYVPGEIQGRIFAVRNALQFGTIPVGILMGGFLADYVLEPLMRTDLVLVKVLRQLAGTGAGSGMAVMFLCTGVTGALFSLLSYQNKEIRKL